jgi:large subunit ribosomal protein L28
VPPVSSAPFPEFFTHTPLDSIMSKVCEVTGARGRRGNRIHHSGLAKKYGGIGLNHVKKVPRDFSPNLREKKLWVPELNRFVKVKLTARALKTCAKNGVYNVLRGAGLVK